MTREAILSCPFTDEQLATPQSRDALNVSPFCRQTLTQFCLYDCKYATILVLRDNTRLEVIPDEEERGNPDSLLLGC